MENWQLEVEETEVARAVLPILTTSLTPIGLFFLADTETLVERAALDGNNGPLFVSLVELALVDVDTHFLDLRAGEEGEADAINPLPRLLGSIALDLRIIRKSDVFLLRLSRAIARF